MHDVLEEKLYDYLSPSLVLIGYAEDHIAFGYENGSMLTGDRVVMSITGVGEDLPPETLYLYDEVNNPDILVNEEVVYRNTITLAVDMYGANVLGRAARLKSLLFSSDMVLLAQRLNLGFKSFAPTRNLTAVINNAYTPRATFELEINTTEIEVISVGTIGQVTVTGHDEEGNLIVDETIAEPGFITP